MTEPDGTRSQIFVVDVDGENLTQITDGDFANYNVEWSPDGTEFLFISEHSGDPHIYVTNIDGSEQTLTNTQRATLLPPGHPMALRSSLTANVSATAKCTSP